MKLYRLTAALSAAVMLFAAPISSISAYAAVTDEQKKEITDSLFEIMWKGSVENYYRRKTDSFVPIEDNPLAATTYMTIEAEVAVCNETLLEQVYNGEVELRDFYSEDDYDYTKAKKINKYSESLLQGYEMSPVDYQNGVWEFDDQINGGLFNGYFREDSENFKLYDNETNELLGTYPRLIGYDYLDDEGNGGGGAGGSGGGAGGSGGTSSGNTSMGSYPSDTVSVGSRPAEKSDDTKSTVVTSDTKADKTVTVSQYDTDNPAVTPEIASAVDAMKSNAGNTSAESATPTKSGPPEKNNNPTVVIVIVAVIVVGVAAFFFTKKKKDGSQQK